MIEKIKKIDKEKAVIFGFGLIIGLLIMLAFYPERIAQLKNGEEVAIKVGKTNITADTLYENFKEKYAVDELIEVIDKTILEKKYELTEEDLTSIENTAQNYISMYEEYYGVTEEEFLTQGGFESYEEFTKYLELDYLRNKYYQEYLNDQITDEEIDTFYEESVYETINVEHILVQTEELSETEALELANEILKKLKNGTSWDTLKDEYRDDIVTEEIAVKFDSQLEETFKTAAEDLKDASYTKSLVKTSYGYHIIYRINSEEKEDKDDVEARIRASIISEKEAEDANLYQKVLITMREEANTDIKDTVLNKEYKLYIKDFE